MTCFTLGTRAGFWFTNEDLRQLKGPKDRPNQRCESELLPKDR